jgi:hypothetical protein
LNPEITPAANQLVLRLLKKNPEQRFESYNQLLEAMDAVGDFGAEGDAPPRK